VPRDAITSLTQRGYSFVQSALYEGCRRLTVEIAGSLLLLLGLCTRPVAFILSGEMAVAYFIAHAPQGHFFSPSLNPGEEAVLYCSIVLFLSVAGGGAARGGSLAPRSERIVRLHRQGKGESGPSGMPGCGPQSPAVGLDNRSTNRQAHAQSSGLGRVERLKYLLEIR
jgi:hypothetical protein